jgi:mono/diheme cytochrome c family protein
MKVTPKNGSLVLFAIAGILVGCSGGSTDSSSTNTASTTPTTSPAAPSAPPASASSSAAAPDGATLFAQNCAGCHGDAGKGGKRAPTLAGGHKAADQVASIVAKGKGKMPAFGTRLKAAEIDEVAKYVSTL